jgi:hypothetical protein
MISYSLTYGPSHITNMQYSTRHCSRRGEYRGRANEREVKGTPEESEKVPSRVLIMIYESFHRQAA